MTDCEWKRACGRRATHRIIFLGRLIHVCDLCRAAAIARFKEPSG